jgi:PEP-CTERM motif
MKTVTLALLVVLASAVFGFAGVCQPNSYDKYLGPGFACGILDKNFFNFSYSTSGFPVGMPPESITVNPLNTPANPGLLFNGPWISNEPGGGDLESVIGFTVTSSGAPITDLSLQMFNPVCIGTLQCTEQDTETYCLGDTFADSCLTGIKGQLLTFAGPGGIGQLSDSVSFAGVREVDVVDDILVGQGGHLSSASIDAVQNNFSETPEPSSIILFGTGILGLAGVLRRKL